MREEIIDTLKGATSLRARSRVARARASTRKVLPGRRLLPDFLIIGAQRSGTSSLYKYLGQHPSIVPSVRKETDYFSGSHGRGQDWYRSHFPTTFRRDLSRLRGRPLLTFEATPFYLVDPHSPARVASEIPAARLIALLRNPVERAFSHYLHNRRLEHEPLSFDDALEAEHARLDGEMEKMLADPSYRAFNLRRFSYIYRGRYAEQLERWMAVFPSSQLLVLPSEDFYARTEEVYHRVLDFLGLPPWTPPSFRNYSYSRGEASRPEMSSGTQERLKAYFEPHNERLRTITGAEINW